MSARPPNTEKVRPLPCVMKEGKGAMSGVRGTAYVPTFITDTVDTGPAELLPGEVAVVKHYQWQGGIFAPAQLPHLP